MGMKGISEHYKDESIYQNTLMGGIFCVIGAICSYVGMSCAFLAVANWLFLGVAIALVVVALVFMIMGVLRVKKAFNVLAERSGEKLFGTASTLLWIGALLTIIFIGSFLMFIAFIIAGIAFLTLKTNQNTPTHNYTTSPTQSTPTTSASDVKSNFCPNCGTAVAPDATFCATCGKQN
jgi:uncharacterized membrane protein